MTKRETQRLTRRALRLTKMSPETFAATFGSFLWDASGRTVRRWANGETTPHASVSGALRQIISEYEAD